MQNQMYTFMLKILIQPEAKLFYLYTDGPEIIISSNTSTTTYQDRPNMLRNFGNMIFHSYVTPALSDWIFDLGLQAASWATVAIAYAWLNEEELFKDMAAIHVPTLILHGLNDKVCLYPLAIAQQRGIANAKLVPFESCGHFLFYDQLERFNKELVQFIEE